MTVRERGDLAFREAFAHAAIGMALVSLEGKWLRVNEALCRMIGFTEAELLVTTFQAVTHPEDLQTDLEYVRRLVAGEITHYHMEKRYIRRDGSELPILLSVALVREADGTPVHFISQIQDLTSQRRLVADRLAAARRLSELERQASMNLIAGSIAHDFNNRLASVIGFTTLAREHAEPGSVVSHCLQEIERASQGAVDLAQQMLAYTGSSKLTVTELDVRSLVTNAAREALVVFPGTRLEVESIGQLPAMAGDRAGIQQALVNMLVNACEAVRETGGLVRIGAAGVNGDLRIQISDNGAGIDPAVQPRIFDPFFTTKFIGRGLGLSAALGIVRAHHGTIDVDSTPGVGTRMTVVLPIMPEPCDGPAAGSPPLP